MSSDELSEPVGAGAPSAVMRARRAIDGPPIKTLVSPHERLIFGAGVAAGIGGGALVAAVQEAIPKGFQAVYILSVLAVALFFGAYRAFSHDPRRASLEGLAVFMGSVGLLSLVLVVAVDVAALATGGPFEGGNFLVGLGTLVGSAVAAFATWNLGGRFP